MRYIMKGGVWKNSQDQILKAAIMKYGLNQWSRISSLLQRKSAKQCKQRWYQWLDPSIKKTQWSRAEDQKLLQLARVFPSQWRTIAPYVGRTPTQCFQRYQKLLDFAQGKTGQQTQDLKRLRPGEIDPNPQTKPARLDPIDMDEDEKQMLAEVRVRLANTKGKKAKRKQRQKIIEQARRLAQLQKIRQLEMAGVDNIPTAKQIKRMRQKQDIDYNKQVPFKREVPQFVYKLQQNETSRNTFFASTISLQTLQGKRRDVQQQLQRKLDKKRIKRLKDTDYKAMLALKSKFEKPVSAPIQLPQPQLADKDLQDMKKYNITTPLKSLIDNATPFGMTPENKILLSARVNYSLNHVMTPIGERHYGEQNDEQDRDQNEQFDGVQKLNYLREIQRKQKDPNKMRSVQRLISERVKTPLSHNQWEGDRSKVTSLFKNLRKPENIIQFAIEEQQQEQQQNEQQLVMDAQEQQKYEIENEKKKAQQRLNSRNMALKLNLQRVKKIPVGFTPSMSSKIQSLIQKQMVNMLYSDMIDYPIQICELPEQHKFEYLSPIPEQKRKQILELIQSEAKKQAEFDIKVFQKKYHLATKHIVKDMKNKKVNVSNKQVKVEQLAKQYLYPEVGNLQSYKMHEKAVEQAEKKAKKYLGGYDKLINTKIQDINNLSRQLEKLRMEKKTLQILSHHESMSATKRIEKEEAYYKIIYNSI